MGADPRFFERLGPLGVSGLAERIGAVVQGDSAVRVTDPVEPSASGPGTLCFLAKTPREPFDAEGGVVLAPSQEAAAQVRGAAATLVSDNPKAAFARATAQLIALRRHEGGALIDKTARIAEDAHIAPGAIIGADAQVGPRAEIGAGAVIGPGVEIGADTRIGARAAIQCALIGERCEIYAGAVLGEAGFGLAPDGDVLISIPHIGRVIVEDDVTVGANCTVDRGMLGDTRLGRSCRIDNLCHIAHNVQVGPYAVMAAFAGISGSVTVGAGAQFGGRVGVADHLVIGDGARLAADAAVMRGVPAGETWAGSPAQPIQRFMRETAWLRQAAGKRKRDKGGK
ncbi:MAG: UDP-3-O-(3-hydroxymyristoyl)glucosamine N-acyltransferase [Alphaproteobacteria bacterium]|nr:UDP-3-O-(3-hydroxymyristoyl)glucosamine N-acyltransferase [Alphaproteobacteria bacterium]